VLINPIIRSWTRYIRHAYHWHVTILSYHLRLGLNSGPIPTDFPTKTLYAVVMTPLRATSPAYLTLLDLFWLYLAKSRIYEAPHFAVGMETNFIFQKINTNKDLLELAATFYSPLLQACGQNIGSRARFTGSTLWRLPSLSPSGCRNITFNCECVPSHNTRPSSHLNRRQPFWWSAS
jgi:hypothetical protein